MYDMRFEPRLTGFECISCKEGTADNASHGASNAASLPGVSIAPTPNGAFLRHPSDEILMAK